MGNGSLPNPWAYFQNLRQHTHQMDPTGRSTSHCLFLDSLLPAVFLAAFLGIFFTLLFLATLFALLFLAALFTLSFTAFFTARLTTFFAAGFTAFFAAGFAAGFAAASFATLFTGFFGLCASTAPVIWWVQTRVAWAWFPGITLLTVHHPAVTKFCTGPRLRIGRIGSQEFLFLLTTWISRAL